MFSASPKKQVETGRCSNTLSKHPASSEGSNSLTGSNGDVGPSFTLQQVRENRFGEDHKIGSEPNIEMIGRLGLGQSFIASRDEEDLRNLEEFAKNDEAQLNSSSLFDLYEKAYRDITKQRVRNRMFLAEQLMYEEVNDHSLFSDFDMQHTTIHTDDETETEAKVCIFDLDSSSIDKIRDGFNRCEVSAEMELDLESSFRGVASVSTSHFLGQEEAAVREAEDISRRMARELEQWSLQETNRDDKDNFGV
jgi:hypothetical protein